MESEEGTVVMDPCRSGSLFKKFPDWGDLALSRDILLTGNSRSANKDVPALLEALDGTVYCNEATAKVLEKNHGNPDRIVVVRPGMKLFVDGLTVTTCEGETPETLSFTVDDGNGEVTLWSAVPSAT